MVKNKEEYAISELDKWIKSLTTKQLHDVAVIAGEEYFTPIQLVEAVNDKKNPYGKMLVRMFDNYRIEMAKKTKK